METIHGKLVVRARFISPNPKQCFLEPIIYTKHYVTKEESYEEFNEFKKINEYNYEDGNNYGRLTARWIPYPESV
jgi:hypothetical protein